MVKSKVSKTGEITAYSEVAFRNNNAMIEYCRTSACALSGCTAGIMGLTGLQGFAFYFCAVIGLWCLLLLKAGPSWEKYFVNRLHLLTNGFFGGLFNCFRRMFCFGRFCLEWSTFTETNLNEVVQNRRDLHESEGKFGSPIVTRRNYDERKK